MNELGRELCRGSAGEIRWMTGKLIARETSMDLIIKNLGKLHEETIIQFDGITVLAGDNGSGKSTVSKALYCVFHGFYGIEERVFQDRKREITNILMDARIPRGNSRKLQSMMDGFVDSLINVYKENKKLESIIDCITQLKMQLMEGLSPEELARKIEQVLLISDEEICQRLLMRTLQNQYNGNIANVNFPEEKCSVRLIVKGKEISVDISPDGRVTYQKETNLLRDVIYVDDSFGEDSLFGKTGWYSSDSWWAGNGMGTDAELEKDGPTAAGELLNEQKAESIFSLMAQAGIGEMHRNEQGRWVYAAPNLSTPVGIRNISSGTKAFLTLKHLIRNDLIENKGVLILDEPEVHLHPKWQELYAEIIVLLQKNYNLTLLVSTHSADFVSFLEYYTRKHGSSQKCRYYLMNNMDDGSYAMAENVTGSIDRLYRELSMSYIRISEKLAEESDP